MASAFPGGIDSVADIVNPTVTDCNVAPTLSQRLNLATDAMTAVETYILNNVAVWSPIPGEVRMFAGGTTPTGWLLCDGSSQLRSSFPNLFAAIGTTWGSVDANHFNLPDGRGRSPMGTGSGSGLTSRTLGQTLGEENHLLSIAELASHAHSISDPGHTHGASDSGHQHTFVNALHSSGGTLPAGSTFGAGADLTGVASAAITVAAAVTGINGTTASGSSSAHNTVHPVVVFNFIIKT